MAHEYEYATLVEYLTPVKLGGQTDYTNPKIQASLTKEFAKLFRNLPTIIDNTPDNEGWWVNSHSVTKADETIVVSILLQRRRK